MNKIRTISAMNGLQKSRQRVLHNLCQSNIVLQRDKPVTVWGWAAPGEQVAVSFPGQTQTATAEKDRIWKVMLTAMPANAQPQKMTLQGKDKTFTLEKDMSADCTIGLTTCCDKRQSQERPLQL